MRNSFRMTVLGALLTGFVSANAYAQAPADATAKCKDGTYTTAKTTRGACSGHGGVATWIHEPQGTATTTAKSTSSTARTTTAKSSSVHPSDATGQCADATYTKAHEKRGACSGHGGVRTWYADTTASTAAAPRTTQQPTSAPPAAPRPTTQPPAAPSSSSSTVRTVAPPANAPANATAQCNDGTFSFARQHRGACSSHKGVKEWYK